MSLENIEQKWFIGAYNVKVLEIKNGELIIDVASSGNLTKEIASGLVGGALFKNKNKVSISALSNINLSINDGDRIALLGLNGAGKTTLLKMLAGVYEPTSGVLEVHQKVTSLLNIGVGINGDLTGRENAIIKLLFRHVDGELARQCIEDIEKFCSIGHFFDLPVSTYSAGMKGRLTFAIATSITPEVLLMDEWIGAGDSEFRDKAKKRIDDMAESSNVLVFATHSAGIVERWATRCVWMDKGRIREDGAVGDVLKNYQTYVKSL